MGLLIFKSLMKQLFQLVFVASLSLDISPTCDLPGKGIQEPEVWILGLFL